jgi:hypothetical protein
LIMEDQQEQLIDKDEFDCDSEYQYIGWKDKAILYQMQQEYYKQIINEDREENNNNNVNKDIFRNISSYIIRDHFLERV